MIGVEKRRLGCSERENNYLCDWFGNIVKLQIYGRREDYFFDERGGQDPAS